MSTEMQVLTFFNILQHSLAFLISDWRMSRLVKTFFILVWRLLGLKSSSLYFLWVIVKECFFKSLRELKEWRDTSPGVRFRIFEHSGLFPQVPPPTKGMLGHHSSIPFFSLRNVGIYS
jgi:hypothetical protein